MAEQEWDLSRSGGALARIDDLKVKKAKALEAGDMEYVTYYTNEIKKVHKSIESEDFEWDEEDLGRNKPVLNSYKRFWESKNGKPWEGTEEELAEDYKSTMGWFDYNLVSMGDIALDAQGWSDEQLKDFGIMMDGYDKLDLGAWSTVKNVGRIAADPTSWIGLGTLGAGTVAAQGGKIAAKSGIKALIKNRLSNKTIKAGAIGAGEAGAYTAADDLGRQETENPNADYDLGRGAKAFGTGAVLGGAIGGTVGRWAQKSRLKKGKGDAQDYYDAARRENKANLYADTIRRNKADSFAIGEAAGKVAGPKGFIGRTVEKATKLPFIKDFAEGYKKGTVPNVQPNKPMPTGAEIASNLGQAAALKGKARWGKYAPGVSGTMAGAQAGGIVLDTTRRVAFGLAKKLTGGNVLGSTRRNILRPFASKRGRKIARQRGLVPEQLDEAGLVRTANKSYIKAPYGDNAGSTGSVVDPTTLIRRNSGAAPPQANVVARPNVKGQKVDAGVLGVSKELKAKIDAGKATKSEKVKYKLGTDGTVSIKDVKLTKIQLSSVKSGKSTVRVNKKTGEVSVCPK